MSRGLCPTSAQPGGYDLVGYDRGGVMSANLKPMAWRGQGQLASVFQYLEGPIPCCTSRLYSLCNEWRHSVDGWRVAVAL